MIVMRIDREMARHALPLVLIAALSVAACAGSKAHDRRLQDQIESIRLSPFALENRISAVETGLTPKTPPGAGGQAGGAPLGQTPSKAEAAPSVADEGPDALYDTALRLLRQEDKPEEARVALERFAQLYPQHKRLPNVLYWTGECFYDQREYPAAILAFRKVVVEHPKHSKAAAALLKMGYSYLSLDDVSNAQDYLGRVEQLYPGTEPAATARAALERLNARLQPASKEDGS
ncbi:MAG: tol-pal system protein YbgF [Pseudomonadota bacterium]